MRKYNQITYTKRIKRRIHALYLAVAAMLIYMVVVGEMGGGDSRMMDDFANTASTLIFFGGLAYLIFLIVHNKKLLQNRLLLKEQQLEEADERNRYLHDKSGGIVMDILLICILFITVTSALFNMAAFYASFAILALAVALKVITYYLYCHKL